MQQQQEQQSDDANTIDRLRRRSNKQQQQMNATNGVVVDALDAISDIDYQDTNGDTALIIACGSQKQIANVSVIEAIIAKGANMNLRNKEGLSALAYAAMHGRDIIVKRLCALGANLEI